MRIALLQAEARPLDVPANLDTLRVGAEQALAAGAELLISPELFLTGYAPVALRTWLASNDTSDIPGRVAALAEEIGIAVVASYPHQHGGTSTISAGFWDASGRQLLRYDKVHLWGDDEKGTFASADAASEIVDWNGWNVGLQICYDIEFPEPIRELVRRGADLVLVPTAIGDEAQYVPDLLVPARAAENGVIVAYADYPATEQGGASADPVSFAGNSVVANWNGTPLAKADMGPGLLIAELPDPSQVPAGNSVYLQERRPDVYEQWARSDRPRRTAP